MSEQELLKKLRTGDALAYKFLFSEYYNYLYNYIYKLSGNAAISEDVVQEAMIKIWEKKERILITTSLKSYLFKSCHNQFLMHLRKEKRRLDVLDTIRWEVLFEMNSTENDEQESRLHKLHSLIDSLPPRCKEVFVKSKFEKKKYKEIALDMGISIKAVEAQMSKALHFLREHASLFML
ncbi:RNA polymerase sigma factor [Spongiimicrobium salis]|uniref:RNA polymerase sigma factor n=1 Tax=Spongiimicrobium salis TaxID=1667022 RepID=UPI00374DFA6E